MRKKKEFKKFSRPGELPKGRNTQVTKETTLLPFLFSWLKDLSKNSVKAYLKHKKVWVDGRVTTQFDTPLKPGNTVLISNEQGAVVFNHSKIKLVWEDKDLIVIDKAEGLLSVSTSRVQEQTAYFLLTKYAKKLDPRNKIFLLHRLDKGTSGLMIFARNQEMKEIFRSDWHTRITKRSYIAVIEGHLEQPEGTIHNFLVENSMYKVYVTHEPNEGKESITHYKVLRTSDEYSLVELTLETGRKNQIRAHMENLGHPIAGDPKYGALTDPNKRLMLHAFRLFFTHPVTQEEMRFETPIPRDFSKLF